VSSVVRLSPETFEVTKLRAVAEERTASAVIRRALILHLADDEPQEQRPA